MKRLTLILMAHIMCVTMCACAAISRVTDTSKVVSESNSSAVSQAESEVAVSKESEEIIDYQDEIDNVEELISAIENPESISAKADIDAAREAYDALPEEAQDLVENYTDLATAESINSVVVESERSKLYTYLSNFEEDVDKVEDIIWYMHKNMPDYIDTRSYIIPYVGVRNGEPWICVRYNYTEDDWVFWKNLTIVVDGKKYQKTVGYFNTIRDNDGGVVWEYYDEVLNVKESMDSYSVEMLRAISESSETIIRFQGDDYHYDLVVSNKDKAMIKDVLDLYQSLLLQ